MATETRYSIINLTPASSGFGIYTWTEKPAKSDYYADRRMLILDIEDNGYETIEEEDFENESIENISGLIENEYGDLVALRAFDGGEITYGMIVEEDMKNTLTINWTALDQWLTECNEAEQEAFVAHARLWASENGYDFETIRDIQRGPVFISGSSGNPIDPELNEQVSDDLLRSMVW